MISLSLELTSRESTGLGSASGSATFSIPRAYQCTGGEKKKTAPFPAVSAKKTLEVESGSSREGRWVIFIKLLGTVGKYSIVGVKRQ